MAVVSSEDQNVQFERVERRGSGALSICRSVLAAKRNMGNQLGASSDAKHIRRIGGFNGARRYSHMACDFDVGPSTAGEHGHGELCGR